MYRETLAGQSALSRAGFSAVTGGWRSEADGLEMGLGSCGMTRSCMSDGLPPMVEIDEPAREENRLKAAYSQDWLPQMSDDIR